MAGENYFSKMYENTTDGSLYGGSAVAIPGALKGLGEIHRRFGKLTWKQVVTPVADLAKRGFIAGESLASSIQEKEDHIRNPFNNLGYLLNDDGSLKNSDDIVYDLQQAQTLYEIADFGAEFFYSGDLSIRILDDITNAGGAMTQMDIENYYVVHDGKKIKMS